LTLDDDVERTANGIKIPEQSSGSELFFFFWKTNKSTKLNENENKITEQQTKY
jgi:hypothetical protein